MTNDVLTRLIATAEALREANDYVLSLYPSYTAAPDDDRRAVRRTVGKAAQAEMVRLRRKLLDLTAEIQRDPASLRDAFEATVLAAARN